MEKEKRNYGLKNHALENGIGGIVKVFGVINHIAHQYDLLKISKKYDVEFTYLENNVRRWSQFSARPMPDDLKWATYYEPGKYDVAILHVDQQHVNPELGKSKLYEEMNAVIQDIPKIVINHGSPMYPEMYDEDMVINGGEIALKDGSKEHLRGMKEKIGDNFMVVNSYEAVKRWGWGYPIIHGIEPSDWWDLPKEPRVVLQLSPGGMDAYNNRQLLSQIKSYLKEKTGFDIIHIPVDLEPRTWDEQREFLGRSLIHLTVAKDSPMPRSRTEAMLSGCLVLTSRYHDADKFIEHGINGLIMPDNPMSYVETLEQLLNFHYRDAVELGQKGKETAIKYFNPDRYHAEWWELLNKIKDGQRPEWSGKTIYQ